MFVFLSNGGTKSTHNPIQKGEHSRGCGKRAAAFAPADSTSAPETMFTCGAETMITGAVLLEGDCLDGILALASA